MPRARRYGHFLLPALLFLCCNCAGKYFRDAGKPPWPSPHFNLSDWPYKEYWTGIVFNGAKVGFSHFSLSPSKSAPDRFDIRSEAAFCIRFLMFDKKINLKSYDQVAGDLSLECFSYEYDLDGNWMKLNGRLADNQLEVDIETRGQKHRQTIPVKGKLYPTSIIGLYPAMHGLEIGRSYTYKVYDGETQTVSPVEQKILTYEESDLFPGQAFKISTRFHGQEVTTWMDPKGRPLLEMSMRGVIISELESKSTAMRYLTQAAINKEETLLDFSLIKSDIPISNPRQVKFMKIAFSGIDKNMTMPVDERQQCERRDNEVFCRIFSQIPDGDGPTKSRNHGGTKQYLQPSYVVPSHNRLIQQTAKEIVSSSDRTHQQILLLLDWIKENIKQEPVDVFTALDVLDGKKAECQGLAFLYTAFARALEIPTRVVSGIVYSRKYQGFLYHAWAESLENGHWIAVDPTFQQMPADASHIKFIEGENISDLLPLVDLIGKIKLRIIQVDNSK
jgi:hypothetical protein